MPGFSILGSAQLQKVFECLKTLARSSTSLLTLTEGLSLGGVLTATGAITGASFTCPTAGTIRNVKVKKVALANVDTAGGVFAFSPGVAGYVVNLTLNATALSTGACTIDAGVAANATTLSDNLIDGVNVAASTGVTTGFFSNGLNAGTNGKASKLFGATDYITGSKASGASAGLAGYAYIHYVEL